MALIEKAIGEFKKSGFEAFEEDACGEICGHFYFVKKQEVQHENRMTREVFLKLVDEVRLHRIKMGSGFAPAAPLDVNILELVQKICDEDFYKEDYRETTLKLISDSLDYEMLKKHYQELVKRIF